MAATSSARLTQLIHCLPLPSFPSTPKRHSRARRWSAPPWEASTMPLRMRGTRIPAASAGAAAPSHAVATSARKPWPVGLSSVSCSSPRSP
jgi:hypothetical protein